MHISRTFPLAPLLAALACGGEPISAEVPPRETDDDRDVPADSFEDERQDDDAREQLVEPEAEERPTGTQCPDAPTLTWEGFGRDFMTRHCLDCHSQTLEGAARHDAPVGVDFDTPELVRAHAHDIDRSAGLGPDAANRSMPPGGVLPTDQERADLSEWLACGAPETDCDLPGASCPPPVACDEGDQNYVDPVTGHCYMLFARPSDWESARRSCEALGEGAALVTIQSGDENGKVADLVDDERVWLGASDRSRERDWRWVTGESLISTFTYWEGTGPDGGEDDDCVEMLGAAMARWTDTACDVDRSYVCERGEECLCDVTDLCDESCSCDTECDLAGGCACDVSSGCDDCWCEPVDDCPAQEAEHTDEDPDDAEIPEWGGEWICDCDWTWGACDLFGNDWDGWYECDCDPDCDWG